MTTGWASKYVGLPFVDGGRDVSGCDCWGLVKLVLADQAGLQLPRFEDIAALDGARVNRAIRETIETGCWQEINRADAGRLDVVVMRGRVRVDGVVHAAETHVGIVVDDRHLMHIETGINAVIVKMSSFTVRDRIRRFFRHEALT